MASMRLLASVCALLTLAACSAWPSAPPLRTATSTPTDVAERVDIGGRSLYLECHGAGSPVVILEAGLRNTAGVWSAQISPTSTQTMVMPGVAVFTRVCAYDRPGTTLGVDVRSRSDPAPMPRTVGDAVADLHALLTTAHIQGPYVLVGHSTGGMIVRLYASEYPGDVAGMVWVDALPEDMQAHMSAEQYATFVRLNEDAPESFADYKELETIRFDASFAQMRVATALKPMPLAVLSRGVSTPVEEFPSAVGPDFGPAFEQAWQIEQNRLATLVPGTKHIIADKSGHYIMLFQPELVIDAVHDVVTQVRER